MPDGVRRWIGIVVTVAATAIVIYGVVADEGSAGDRAQALADRLRCPVCQSESVADSTSQTARDMRALIDELIGEGRSDADIEAFFVARYGEWILLDPSPTGRGLLLWALPIGALAVGALTIASRRRRAVR